MKDDESYFSNVGEFPLLNLTVGQLVEEAARKFGDSLALYIDWTGERLTFSDVAQETRFLAGGFLELGLNPGDRIGICGSNSRQWYVTWLAAARAGLIAVCINPASTGPELLYCMNHVSIKCIVIAGQFRTVNLYKVLTDVIPDLEQCSKGNLNVSRVPSLTTVISMENQAPGKAVYPYDEILKAEEAKTVQDKLDKIQATISPQQIFNIQFTSGSTGKTKGVTHTHHNAVNNSFLMGRRMGLTSKDKSCMTVPLFHLYGTHTGILTSLHNGSALIFPSPTHQPETAVRVAAQQRCTFIYGTPTMHIDMINCARFEKYDLSSLRAAVGGGSACPKELITKMKIKYGVEQVINAYGTTESGVFTMSLPEDSDDLRSLAVGFPIEHSEIKLVNRGGKIVSRGKKGEMCVRGYNVMHGYWNDPEKTNSTIDSEGWLHTGDEFVMLKSGHLVFKGRIVEMINRGGESIHPKEIEEVLHTHPAIVEAHVFGLPDPRLGEVIATWIRLQEDYRVHKKVTMEDVQHFCGRQISYSKIPKYVKFVGEFPKTSTGKIPKYLMRHMYTQELGLVDLRQ